MSTAADNTPQSHPARTYLLVAAVAATVSAATVAYVLWRRGLWLTPRTETVQDMLDRCRTQVHAIESRLEDLRQANSVNPA